MKMQRVGAALWSAPAKPSRADHKIDIPLTHAVCAAGRAGGPPLHTLHGASKTKAAALRTPLDWPPPTFAI